MENNPKPPTQSVGVAGFKADLYASDVQQDDVQEVVIGWHILIHLPKFQMYAVQMTGTRYGQCGNVMEWVMGYVQDRIQSDGERNFFDEFVKWHDEKGYWKAEDIYGNLLNEVENGNS